MADIQLPPPIWKTKAYDGLQIDEIDLIFQRLIWPSPLVRERAATAIADLLIHSSQRELIYKKYLKWISSQAMESILAIALLPFFRVFQLNDSSDLRYIKFGEIIEALPFGSVVITKLANDLRTIIGSDPGDIEFPEYLNVNICPATYLINDFFRKHATGFLAPIYHTRAEQIESRGGRGFIKQSAFTSDEIISANNIGQDSNLGHFQGREGDVTLTGMSTKLGEVYRSAFIRVCQSFFMTGYIGELTFILSTYTQLCRLI